LLDKLFYQIELDEFVALDIETTGLSPELNHIIEIAAIKYRHGKKTDEFHTLINPKSRIPSNITQITGLSDSDVADQPYLDEKLPEFYKFIDNLPIVGHNIEFDLQFFEYAIRKLEDDFDDWKNHFKKPFKYVKNDQLDTLLFSRILYPYLNSFKLGDLSQHFEINHNAQHRAMSDAEASADLFILCCEDFLMRDISGLKYIVKLLKDTKHSSSHFFQKLLKAKKTGDFSNEKELVAKSEYRNFYNIYGKPQGLAAEKKSLDFIKESEIDDLFSKDGLISKELPNFEYRTEQVDLVHAISEAFNEQRFLLSEAGTGTGKSLSYLVPSILWAIRNRSQNGRVIITTNTKNLQEQLFYKDIPFISRIIKENFYAVLLKGRGNYLCLDRWHHSFEDNDKALNPYEREKALSLVYWKEYTDTGDISENHAFNVEKNGAVWSKFMAESNYCSGKACKHYNDCFMIKARNSSKYADIVIVNHSLLFSSLVTENPFLNEFQNIVFDESHNIEKVATEYLGFELNIWQLRKIQSTLYIKKDKSEKGVLSSFMKRLDKKRVFLDAGLVSRFETAITELMEDLKTFGDSFNHFFTELSKLLQLQKKDLSFGDKIRYREGKQHFSILNDEIMSLDKIMMRLSDHLFHFLEYCKELNDETFDYQQQMIQEIKSAQNELTAVMNTYTTVLNADLEDYVFWAEAPHKIENIDSKLSAAPIKINKLLENLLYKNLDTAIFTSATATVGNSFDYFKKRIGLKYLETERSSELIVESPFNFKQNVKLMLLNYLYEPSNRLYHSSISELIVKVAKQRENGILILFTSYYMLNDVLQMIKYELEALNRKVLAQGKDGSRSKLIDLMREEGNAILFGTDSFWEGVDIPGSALETVIITKLPFDVPSDPIIAAKMDEVKLSGGNSFMDFSVPEAVIKLRQGFGRLVRSKKDKGIVIITDNRMVTKRYGEVFTKSLPLEPNIYKNESDFLKDL
jgi:predicted DnaQ family exonuclease/DinG family helicase